MGAFPGVYTQSEEHALRAIIREEVEAALASAGQPNPRVLDGDPQSVDLIIGNNIISLSRLIHIFQNIEQHSSYVYDQLRAEERMQHVIARVVIDHTANELKRGRHNAMRKAVTVRDSAGQMARLLKGENLDEPEYEEGEID